MQEVNMIKEIIKALVVKSLLSTVVSNISKSANISRR